MSEYLRWPAGTASRTVETQRGFTLVEVLIAVGIIVLVAVGAVTVSASARSMAVSSAANRFDSLLDAARTMARESSNGVTIAFTPDAYGDGFVARLYHNRPGTEPLIPSNAPALEARVSITETETLGNPPFALVIHATGAIAGATGNALPDTAGPETPCPASGRYRFVLAYGGAQVERSVACRINLTTNGPVAYASITPATPQPSPTAATCVQPSCTGLPGFPQISATCPPRYIAKDASTCVNPTLIVSPQTLTFTRPGSPASLSYSVREDYYAGYFHVADNCGGAIVDSYTSGGGKGPISTYIVTATTTSACKITVSDDRNSTPQSVAVGIGSDVLIQNFVCDPKTPPSAYGTDLGPDIDGIHEDLSDGTACTASPRPGPTATPIPTPSASSGPISVLEIEIIDDCDAGSPGSFFDLLYGSNDVTMGQVITWIQGGAKRFAQPNPIGYDPLTAVRATFDERHTAPPAQQCVP